MARLRRVKSSRKEWKCGRCDVVIKKGEPYQWYQKAYLSKTIACMTHTLYPSEYATNSPYKAAAWALSERFNSGDFASSEELSEELNNAAEAVREDCAEALRESAQNMIDGFGHETSGSEELNERADAFDGWADELEGAAQQIEDTEDIDDARSQADEVMSGSPE